MPTVSDSSLELTRSGAFSLPSEEALLCAHSLSIVWRLPMTTTASSSTRPKKSYFDLHIDGVGYVNRIREVTPKRGAPFLACEVAALVGPADSVEYRRFDVRVSGTDAQHLIRRCEQAVKDEKKVLIGFRLGDLWIDIFKYSKGPKEGETGVSLKARLLFV